MFFSFILCLFALSCSAYINDVDCIPSLPGLSTSNLLELKVKVAGSNTSSRSRPASVPYRYDKLFYSFDETTASPLSSYYGGYGNSMTTNGDYLFISSVSSSSSSLSPPPFTTASPSPPSHSLTTTSEIYVYRRVVNSKTWELTTTITDPYVTSFSVDGIGSVIKATKRFLIVCSPSDSSFSYQNGKVLIYDLMKLSDYHNPPAAPSVHRSSSSDPIQYVPSPVVPLSYAVKPIVLLGSGKNEKFGSSLSVNGDLLAVGASGSLYGNVYLYQTK
jgi:hypothetical protein